MGLSIENEDVHDSAKPLAAKVGQVRIIVRAYADTPSVASREITSVDDLFDEELGLPR